MKELMWVTGCGGYAASVWWGIGWLAKPVLGQFWLCPGLVATAGALFIVWDIWTSIRYWPLPSTTRRRVP